MSILYITYDGLLDPLGQSQVLGYVRKLAKNHSMHLITYEKTAEWENIEKRITLREEVRAQGINWIALRYHKAPSTLATAFDLTVGFFVASWLILRHRIKIVHARSYVASVLALLFKVLFRRKFIFDMRGFWVDERIELKRWSKSSYIFRLAKALERQFLTQSDVIVCLTQPALKVLRSDPCLKNMNRRIEVINTCTDLDLFHPAKNGIRESLGANSFTLGYIGSIGSFYMFDEVLECYKEVCRLKENARLVVLNRKDHALIREKLIRHNILLERVQIKSVDYRAMPDEVRKMDAGIFLYQPHPNRVGTSPTRLGEFLASGVPCISDSTTGSVKVWLEENNVGITISKFETASYSMAAARIIELASDPSIKNRCVETARKHFSLSDGVRIYNQIYQDLLS